jgi:hypothetical protein
MAILIQNGAGAENLMANAQPKMQRGDEERDTELPTHRGTCYQGLNAAQGNKAIPNMNYQLLVKHGALAAIPGQMEVGAEAQRP